nr:hypothetical protein [Armatimonas sp.]
MQKLSIGGIHNLKQSENGQQGIGATLDFYAYPSTLKSVYGSAPLSATLFYPWRFGKM